MACEGCEERRREMALILEATKQWRPVGPTLLQIIARLRAERDTTDGNLRPGS